MFPEGAGDAFPVAFANNAVYANDTRETRAFYEEIRGFYA